MRPKYTSPAKNRAWHEFSLRADLHERAADDLAVEQRLERTGQLVERNLVRDDSLERGRIPFGGEAPPQRCAQLRVDVDRVHADQAHAAQDERHHGRLELRIGRKADRRDVAVRPRRREQPREDRAADSVDAASPSRGLARLAVALQRVTIEELASSEHTVVVALSTP